eukprot:gnl/Ergobibamus_cyprinoides/727.p3 GENE.gnl/Ergobibamus_cyprinoides/727~~gnl/Ergobibamus_cyprinoides/727.p3  ORF type:complete len:213 (+),score=69.59 gnl/Ergobibamus_cyprinoides/727:820-1458(+)
MSAHFDRNDDVHVRMAAAASAEGLTDFALSRVPSTYYDESFERRCELIAAGCAASAIPSVDELCKSLVMTNTKWNRDKTPGQDEFCMDNPRHILIIVQYAARIKSNALWTTIRRRGQEAGLGINKKSYSWRLATEEDNAALTGYEHGAVTPIGIPADRIPILVAKPIAEMDHVWIGGGHPDVKLRINVKEFLAAYADRVIIADLCPDADEPQ